MAREMSKAKRTYQGSRIKSSLIPLELAQLVQVGLGIAARCSGPIALDGRRERRNPAILPPTSCGLSGASVAAVYPHEPHRCTRGGAIQLVSKCSWAALTESEEAMFYSGRPRPR